jgi:NAD(P)-dependent dehydrogenase (short-subunit alcohol dehydrogenase family)
VVEATIKRFGRLDGLIHMAGVHCVEPWEEMTAESFDRILSINVAGTFLIARAAALGMAKTGGGSIVLASSGSTNLRGRTGRVTAAQPSSPPNPPSLALWAPLPSPSHRFMSA